MSTPGAAAEGGALSGSVALVSGASRGIGMAVAVAMAEAGADVVGVARSERSLERVAKSVTACGRAFVPVVADLSRLETVELAVRAAEGFKGRIDCLVNAAGAMVRKELLDVSPLEWDELFSVNVRGTFFLSQAVARGMLTRRGGSIVNITSVAGEVVTGASAPYSASKAAVIQLTRVLAVRLAPTVRVNAVGPAYVRTDLNSAWLDADGNLDWVLDRTPLGRVGSPEDVTGAVVFLSSPAAAYVTGQHLLVYGGWTAQ